MSGEEASQQTVNPRNRNKTIVAIPMFLFLFFIFLFISLILGYLTSESPAEHPKSGVEQPDIAETFKDI